MCEIMFDFLYLYSLLFVMRSCDKIILITNWNLYLTKAQLI